MSCGCADLGLVHCACRYMAEDLVAGRAGSEVARRMFKHELPVVDGRQTYHFSGCPCPRCYDLRLQSWELDAIPPAPRRESWPELRGESA